MVYLDSILLIDVGLSLLSELIVEIKILLMYQDLFFNEPIHTIKCSNKLELNKVLHLVY